MSTAPKTRITPEDYLAAERLSATRHELFDGSVVAMAGGSEAHNLISGNALGELRNALRDRGCRVYPGDMRIRVPRTRSYFYADVSVVCGDPEFDDEKRDVLLNPLVVVETLSPSTEAYDRGEKFREYRKIPSLREYVLISQHQPYVEVHSRCEFNRWESRFAEGLDASIELPAVQATILLSDLYMFVSFEESSGPPPGAVPGE